MKNTLKLIGIIVFVAIIGFTMVACDDGKDSGNDDKVTVSSTVGRLTINNIPAGYNGKWIIAMGGDETSGLFAASNVSSSGTITCGQISNRSVTLNIWKAVNENSLGNFNGSGKQDISLLVINKASLSISEMENMSGDEMPAWILDMGYGEVTFNAGIGTLTDAMWMSDY
jgi:hypothetical protein